jgi:hypothetical protein
VLPMWNGSVPVTGVCLIVGGLLISLTWLLIRLRGSSERAEALHELESRLLSTADLSVRLGVVLLTLWALSFVVVGIFLALR